MSPGQIPREILQVNIYTYVLFFEGFFFLVMEKTMIPIRWPHFRTIGQSIFFPVHRLCLLWPPNTALARVGQEAYNRPIHNFAWAHMPRAGSGENQDDQTV